MTEPNGTAAPKRGARTEKEASTALPPEIKKAFPHAQYLEKREGLPYLPLKWRLAWLRAEYPRFPVSRLPSQEKNCTTNGWSRP